ALQPNDRFAAAQTPATLWLEDRGLGRGLLSASSSEAFGFPQRINRINIPRQRLPALRLPRCAPWSVRRSRGTPYRHKKTQRRSLLAVERGDGGRNQPAPGC